MSAGVLYGARYNTLNAWCKKAVQHLDRDQDGKKGDLSVSGKLPNTANSLRSNFRGAIVTLSEDFSSAGALRRSPGNVATNTVSSDFYGRGVTSTVSSNTSL